jgi:hypothetical protein
MEPQLSPDAILAKHGGRVLTPDPPKAPTAASAIALQPGLPPDMQCIPRRAWIGGSGWLIPGALNVASGAPGSLKSTLLGHIAVALAAGVQWAGLEPERPHRVLIAHWEDDTEEMWRRLLAAAGIIAPHGDGRGRIADNLRLIHMAEHGPLIQQSSMMDLRATPAFDMIEAAITQHEPEVLILDPLAEAVAVQENDNAALRLAVAPLRRLAQRHKAAVVAVHHDRKGAEGSALDRMRGGSALGGLIRRHLPVRQMTPEQAREFQVPQEDADGFICLERGKTQYARQRGPAWFRIVSHALPNGDDAAALEAWTPPTFTIGPEHLALALVQVRDGIDGRPLAMGNQSLEWFAPAFEQAGIPRIHAKGVLAQLKRERRVSIRRWRHPERRKTTDRLWTDGNQLIGWVEGGSAP